MSTSADGRLDTPPAEVDRIVAAARGASRVVLHFHGGLVDERAGTGVAARLLPVYQEAGAYPVFFVWRSGLVEIVSGNLREIAGERGFRALVRWVLKLALSKLTEIAGVKGTDTRLLNDNELAVELQRAAQEGREPFASVTPTTQVQELTEQERRQVEQLLRADPVLQAVGAEIAASALPQEQRTGARGAVVRGSTRTLMSPAVVDELQQAAAGARQPGQKGIVTSAALAKKGLSVLVHVIGRFRDDSDHGIYPTVVEEVLREFYLANAGAAVWRMMKQETLDTFQQTDPPRGGRYFLDGLATALGDGAVLPQVTLVGHSTGAVFINNLLGDVERLRADPGTSLPADFRFRNVAFLAPACTFDAFATVLERRDHLWERFRLFAMTDAAERADALLPLYPRSLLYFVSGVCETDAEGASRAGVPLVGMRRHYDSHDERATASMRAVRSYVEEGRGVWSPVDGDDGFSSGARSHGAFDDDEKVRASLRAMIEAP